MRDPVTVVPPEVQRATLTKVLARVAEVAASKVTPVVEVDLDLTALCPRARTRYALALVGHQFGVAEFLRPDDLPLLPGYTSEAWRAFLESTGIAQRNPTVSWSS